MLYLEAILMIPIQLYGFYYNIPETLHLPRADIEKQPVELRFSFTAKA